MKLTVGTKFQLKLTNLVFWTKFDQKEYFQSKTEKMHFSVRPRSLLSILNFFEWGPTDATVF